MDWLKLVNKTEAPKAAFDTGDDVRVWFRILEQGKEGVVMRVRGSGHSKTFTVRRLTHGEGVERVFPIGGRTIERVEVLRRGKVKRSRIYFLRGMAKRVRIASAGDLRPTPAAEAQAEPAAVIAAVAPAVAKTESPS
jgi:large subunit ribosomal protein L19